jgi:hypothetical protein
MQNYVAIHITTGKILSLLNIKKIEKYLPVMDFSGYIALIWYPWERSTA